MNLEQMAYALELAKTASITTASASLNVTQSTISQAITRLEQELGIKLFERSRKGTYPLEEAKVIFDKFKVVLDTVQLIREDADYIGESISGELRLSAIPGGIPDIITAVASMKHTHPGLKFQISEKPASSIVKEVRDKQADLGLIALYKDDIAEQLQGLPFYPIDEGYMYICASRKNPFEGNRSMSLEDLKNQTFVLFNDELIDAFILSLQPELGEINILFRSNNSEVINTAMMQLNAATIGHEYSFKPIRSMQHYEYDIVQLDIPQRLVSIGWIMQESKASNTTIRRFLDRFHYVSSSK